MFIVLDLEATCWKEKPHDPRMEIIEKGAVKVDLAKSLIISEFDMLVRPVLNPELSAFCTELTGIETTDVRHAEYFVQVYPKFVKFCGSRRDNILAAWGDYDKRQLQQDLALHELEWLLPDRYLNVSHLYREIKGGKKRGLRSQSMKGSSAPDRWRGHRVDAALRPTGFWR